jgi:hypothetical protein
MILSVRDKLQQLGLPQERIHVELFSSPEQPQKQHEKWKAEHAQDEGVKSKFLHHASTATVTLDLLLTPIYSGRSLRAAPHLHIRLQGRVCAHAVRS